MRREDVQLARRTDRLQLRLAAAPKTTQPQSDATRPVAQPLEPILVPKLRIYFADFPYLPCSRD